MTQTDTTESQDRVHTPGDDRRWRESFYFSFYDPALGLGGFNSIGKRPASGHSGSFNVLWGPQAESLVGIEYDSFTEFDSDYAAGGLVYDAPVPFGPWRVSFSGPMNRGGLGVECDHAALASAQGADDTVEVTYDLLFTPTHDPYVYRERSEWAELFTGHIDEICTVTGTLTIDGVTHAVDGHGSKDHSWGVRNWFAPIDWRWVDIVSGSAPQLTLWRGEPAGASPILDGAVYGDAGLEPLTSYEEKVELEPGDRVKGLPRSIEASIEVEGARHSFVGVVHRVVPVLFRREVEGGEEISWNDRCLVECTFDDGRVGWANIEFKQVVDVPAADD